MYVKFYFQSNDQVISLDGPSQPAVGHAIAMPEIIDRLPDKAFENKMNHVGRENDKSYYLDCGDLDRATIEKIIVAFAEKNLPKERLGEFSAKPFYYYSSIQIADPNKDGMRLINQVLKALTEAKLEFAGNKYNASQTYVSNRSLLFAVGGLVVGTAVTAAAALTLKNR